MGKTALTLGGGNDRAVFNTQYFNANVGNVWYVKSGGTSGNGVTPDGAFITLAEAISAATASNGDVIYLLPGHAESIGASGLAWNKAGLSIIGLGNGNSRPTFTWHTTDAVVTISAANVLVQNIITKVDLDEVVSMFLVTGAGVTLDTVDFLETASAQAIQWLLTTAAADQLTIKNCFHVQMSAAGSAQKWIALVGTDHSRVVNNTFMLTGNASTSSHLISGTTAVVAAEIGNNRGCWLGATITGIISCVTGSTGIQYDNRFFTGTSVSATTGYVGDGMAFMDNKHQDSASSSGYLNPAADTDT